MYISYYKINNSILASINFIPARHSTQSGITQSVHQFFKYIIVHYQINKILQN